MTPRHPMHEAKWRRYTRFFRPDPAADLDDELRDHLESTVESLVAGGMSPEAARATARRRLGDLTTVRHQVHSMERRHALLADLADRLGSVLADARFALRGFARAPGFVVVAVLSIALAVGANSTVFSVVHTLLFRPIPGTDSERLVRVYVNRHSPFSYTDLAWFREHARSFDGMTGERFVHMGMRDAPSGTSERVRVSMVTRGYFGVLGARMAAGHAFEGDERTGDGARPVAVLAHDFWRHRFGADTGIVGRVLMIADQPVLVVGVASPEFRSSLVGRAPQLYLPAAAAPLLTGTALERLGGSFYTTARLAPGASVDAAGRELDALMRTLARTDTARYRGMTLRLGATRGIEAELRQAVAAGSAFMLLMVGVVLLIACANVANLLLARAAARTPEIGVRMALGASRARIVRGLLVESLLLAAAGSALGLAAAFALTRALGAALPAEAGVGAGTFTPDRTVLLFTAGTCVLTTFLFGLVPALRASSSAVVPMLKGASGRTGRRRGGLVAAQVALCVLTIAVAAHFWRSLAWMQGLDSGFRVAGIVDIPLDLSLVTADSSAQRALFARLLERSRTLPGVRSATLAAIVPLSGSNMETRVVPRASGLADTRETGTGFNVVTDGYFETLAIPVVAGRAIDAADLRAGGAVVVVNETAAAQWWPGRRAIGQRLVWGGADGVPLEVVGVARDADYNMPGEEARPFVYVPPTVHARRDMTVQLHSAVPAAAMQEAVWSMLREEVPTLPPPAVTTMREDMALTLLPVRAGAMVLGALGAIALLLAASGIYGVTAFMVSRRTREIGVRAALGATHGRILRMVVADGLRPVLGGAVIGAALASGVALLLRRVLYGVSPGDPLVVPVVLFGLVLVALVATLLPARRAARVEPTIAMRAEA